MRFYTGVSNLVSKSNREIRMDNLVAEKILVQTNKTLKVADLRTLRNFHEGLEKLKKIKFYPFNSSKRFIKQLEITSIGEKLIMKIEFLMKRINKRITQEKVKQVMISKEILQNLDKCEKEYFKNREKDRTSHVIAQCLEDKAFVENSKELLIAYYHLHAPINIKIEFLSDRFLDIAKIYFKKNFGAEDLYPVIEAFLIAGKNYTVDFILKWSRISKEEIEKRNSDESDQARSKKIFWFTTFSGIISLFTATDTQI